MTDDPAGPTVLLVDDNGPLVDTYRLMLEPAYDVLTATDGAEALDLLTISVDTVLLDRRMPTMAGDEVLRRLRERGYEVPVGLISGADAEIDIVDLPLDAYLTKPLGDELPHLIEMLTARQELDEQSRQFLRLASKEMALEASGRVDQDAPEFRELRRQRNMTQADGGGDPSDYNGNRANAHEFIRGMELVSSTGRPPVE